jgi:hypothetical protein
MTAAGTAHVALLSFRVGITVGGAKNDRFSLDRSPVTGLNDPLDVESSQGVYV